MIKITDKAAKKLEELRNSENFSSKHNVRVNVKGGGCSGLLYDLKFDDKTPLVVIVGAEDKGISLLTQKKCDFLLRIPLKGKTSSLNASVAAAISIFHLTSN